MRLSTIHEANKLSQSQQDTIGNSLDSDTNTVPNSKLTSTFSTRLSHDILFSIMNQTTDLLSHGIIEQSYTSDNKLELHIILAYNSESLGIQTIIGITQLSMEANQLILGGKNFDSTMTHIMFGITEAQIDLLTILQHNNVTDTINNDTLQDEFLVMPCLSYSK